MDVIHYNMFGFNTLKKENKRLIEQNEFLKGNAIFLHSEMVRIDNKLKITLANMEHLGNLLNEKEKELNLINASRRANADDYKEKYY